MPSPAQALFYTHFSFFTSVPVSLTFYGFLKKNTCFLKLDRFFILLRRFVCYNDLCVGTALWHEPTRQNNRAAASGWATMGQGKEGNQR